MAGEISSITIKAERGNAIGLGLAGIENTHLVVKIFPLTTLTFRASVNQLDV